MNITSAKYIADTITTDNMSIKATIDGEVMFVPLDENNTHYAEILRQVADSTITIAAAD